jgi:hypothetical protein
MVPSEYSAPNQLSAWAVERKIALNERWFPCTELQAPLVSSRP